MTAASLWGGADKQVRLTVDTLSGNGHFIMEADFAAGHGDFIDVTGQAHGAHTLLVSSSGADPQEEHTIPVVHTAGGDAGFSLQGGPVDLGVFSYSLQQQGGDWYLAPTRLISPGTESVLALLNTAPTIWYGELATLRGRMGELRRDGTTAGGWARVYGNRYDVSTRAGVGYRQNQQGLSLGVDGQPWDGNWLLGVLAGYSSSDLSLRQGGRGDVDSYYLGAYGTWLDAQTGYYLDGVLKVNHLRNASQAYLSDGQRTDGHYQNMGVGASLEFGRHLTFNNGYFLEPYGQLSAVTIQGKRYQLDNAMRADGDRTRSLQGEVGATLGRTLELGPGRWVQPHARLAVVHEFVKNNAVQVNEHVFDNDLSGSRTELGMGVTMALTEALQMHMELEHARGTKVDQPWGANVGMRLRW